MPLTTWMKVNPSGNLFTARTGHEIIYYENCIYIFGGTDDDDRKNDIYYLDIYMNKMDKLPNAGTPP